MRPKARETTQHGGPSGWLDWRRVTYPGEICVVMGGPCAFSDGLYCLSWYLAAQLWAFGKFSDCCWNSIVLNVHKTPCWIVSLRPSASVFLSYNICGWFVNGVEFEILLVLIVFHCMLCAIVQCTMHIHYCASNIKKKNTNWIEARIWMELSTDCRVYFYWAAPSSE